MDYIFNYMTSYIRLAGMCTYAESEVLTSRLPVLGPHRPENQLATDADYQADDKHLRCVGCRPTYSHYVYPK